MRILVTRPREDAESFAARLRAFGHEVFLEPMMEIIPLPAAEAAIDLAAVQALLFTSANGVRVFSARCDRRDLSAFAVGDATADAARAAGFCEVASAGGDVQALARLVAGRLKPAEGVLFHPAASKQAGDLKGALEAAGFTLRRSVLYQAMPRRALSADLRQAFETKEIDLASFFSPRTAESFARLAFEAGLSEALRSVRAVCLSQAVADKITYLPWRHIAVAKQPTQEALLACLGTG